MATVIIREHNDLARDRAGRVTTLVTSEILAKQTISTTEGTAVDCARFTAKTHFVAIEPNADVRYRIRPRSDKFTPLAAQADDTPAPAGRVVVEPVYPGAIISFLQVSGVGGVGGGAIPFQTSYVPVLLL